MEKESISCSYREGEMMMNIIDAHIHLDLYEQDKQKEIIHNLKEINVASLISVSMNLASAKRNQTLANQCQQVKPAFGFHPEQALPTMEELAAFLEWIRHFQHDMIAIGEVGLPYYLRKEQDMEQKTYQAYIDLLEQFVMLACELDKPIILHAVYDDAPIVCDLLEKYKIEKAHFHWFKGDANTMERMIRNGYHISITPDVLYEEEIEKIVQTYPLRQIMVETDGPWPFEGPFEGKVTHPNMIHDSIIKIAKIKRLPVEEVYQTIFENTIRFYQLNPPFFI